METKGASRDLGTYGVPLVGIATLAWVAAAAPRQLAMLVPVAVLVACVLAAVTHAEVIAHRVGEPLGAIVLALSVTVIEASLIVSLMATHHGRTSSLARDTVSAVICLALYGFFVFFQSISRPEDFQALGLPDALSDHADLLKERPSARQALRSLLLLLVCLVVVVGIAEGLSSPLEDMIARAGAPQSAIGLVIALLVLLPESLTALRAARRDELQTSLNLSLGSAIASIGLTIPTVAILSVILHQHLVLGLGAEAMVLFAVTGLLSAITLTAGEVTLLQGAIHLVLFATFAFLAFNP